MGWGWLNIRHVAQLVASGTFIWPMLVGGLLLGVGFIISGYCPGTSLVSAASGGVDGLLAFVGVIIGSVVFGMVQPAIAGFYQSGDQGQLFIYDLLGVAPAVVACAVAVIAIGCFLGAEKVEKYVTEAFLNQPYQPMAKRPRRFALTSFAIASVAGLSLLVVPVGTRATEAGAVAKAALPMDVLVLAQRVLDEPWQLRIIDLRPEVAFLESRIPGSENASAESLSSLGLKFSAGIKDLVLVDDGASASPPEAALEYPGRVFWLKDGFAAWQRFALEVPTPPAGDASEGQFARYRFQSAVHSALTGAAAPPPPKKTTKFQPPPKRKAGGCS